MYVDTIYHFRVWVAYYLFVILVYDTIFVNILKFKVACLCYISINFLVGRSCICLEICLFLCSRRTRTKRQACFGLSNGLTGHHVKTRITIVVPVIAIVNYAGSRAA